MTLVGITTLRREDVWGTGAISELQRLTVSLRGGFKQSGGCLVFHFTGQLDAYSEKQFVEYVADVLKTSSSPAVFDLSKIDFSRLAPGWDPQLQLAKQCTDQKRSFHLVGNTRVTQTIKLVRLEEFI